MCLIIFAINAHPKYKFILAANRDEYFSRETAFADYWSENNLILAGKDKASDGTWLGINIYGRFVAITNYRDPNLEKTNPISRGRISKDFLSSTLDAKTYTIQLSTNRELYSGYNVIISDDAFESILHYSNVSDKYTNIHKGIYGLSNALLDTPWPKVETGKRNLKKLLKNPTIDPTTLINMLKDDTMADDQHLPDTGIPADLEKKLSPVFISMKGYGTRCSTALLINYNNEVDFLEVSYNEQMKLINEARFRVQLKY